MKEPTWTQIASQLGVTNVTLSKWRSKHPDCPKDSKELKDWKLWIQKKEIDGKGSGRVAIDGKEYSAADIHDLKAKLIAAQERRENAMAQIREIELQQKRDNLIPESEATEQLIKLLTPLRRLLDALPRQIASQANPSNPNIAELAIRNGLDDRVFAEIEKIMKNNSGKA
jgi:hypothetical protein